MSVAEGIYPPAHGSRGNVEQSTIQNLNLFQPFVLFILLPLVLFDTIWHNIPAMSQMLLRHSISTDIALN